MESHFEIAFAKYMNSQQSHQSQAVVETVTRFARSNRERGHKFLDLLEKATGASVAGKRVLDIGSAYGGFVIEAAKAGAEAYGVEILEYLHKLALENVRDEPIDANFIFGDFLNLNTREQLGPSPFDVIILNDVFEHIYDFEHLFRCIKSLCHSETVLYFAIPNGDSHHMIECEGHRQLFGLTLLEPGAWSLVTGTFNIYYRPYVLYQSMFRMIGLPHIYLAHAGKLDKVIDRTRSRLNEIKEKVLAGPFTSRDANAMASRKVRTLIEKFEEDAIRLSAFDIFVKYEDHFWEGFASGRPLTPTSDLNMTYYTFDQF